MRTLMLLLLLIAFSSSALHAETAIVEGRYANGAFYLGYRANHRTISDATERALSECNHANAFNCRVVKQLNRQCFAMAQTVRGGYALATASDTYEARNLALRRCAELRDNCTIRWAECDTVSEAAEREKQRITQQQHEQELKDLQITEELLRRKKESQLEEIRKREAGTAYNTPEDYLRAIATQRAIDAAKEKQPDISDRSNPSPVIAKTIGYHANAFVEDMSAQFGLTVKFVKSALSTLLVSLSAAIAYLLITNLWNRYQIFERLIASSILKHRRLTPLKHKRQPSASSTPTCQHPAS